VNAPLDKELADRIDSLVDSANKVADSTEALVRRLELLETRVEMLNTRWAWAIGGMLFFASLALTAIVLALAHTG